MNHDSTARRGFLARLAVAAPLLAMPWSAGAMRAARNVTLGPDEAWLDALKGRYRTVFDVDSHRNGHALAQGRSLLDAWRDAYGVPEQEINLVMGVRGTGLPIVLRDEIWEKYEIGRQYGIIDPATGAPSVRNLFIDAHLQPGGPASAGQTVEALRKRGVTFLVCRNTIAGATRKLAGAGLGTTTDIHATLTAGIIPQVIIVPAMVIAFTRMQQRGIAYVYAG